MVQEIVSQLQLAEKDRDIRAVVLKIDSPGGTTTGSDILYHEIKGFKERTRAKIIVVMMNLATSGGYYVSLPADHIIAHPTTVTGSIGVIFIRPKVASLMEKLGLDVEVDKFGENKDMGSPFRKATDEEHRIFQEIIESLGGRFVDLVAEHRKLDPESVEKITSARVYLAKEALDLNLIDEIGYLSDAVKKAKALADLPEDASVVVYRRTEYPDDNLYNTSTSFHGAQKVPLIGLNVPDGLSNLQPGFYYLWTPFGGDD
jgi:protease-4